MGETDFEVIYNRVTLFLKDAATNEVPIVFIKEDDMDMMVSVMENLSDKAYNEREFDIFPLEELFFALKQETGRHSKNRVSDVKSIHIAKTLLEIDPNEYRSEIACEVCIDNCNIPNIYSTLTFFLCRVNTLTRYYNEMKNKIKLYLFLVSYPTRCSKPLCSITLYEMDVFIC